MGAGKQRALEPAPQEDNEMGICPSRSGNRRGFSIAFYWGERGYYFVEAPGGKKGHAITKPGFDGVAFNPKTRHLILYDNKSFKSASNVASVSAMTKNLAQNLQKIIQQVAA